MSREIRRVVSNWQHPRRSCPHSPWKGGCDEARRNGGECFQPLFDEGYETAMNEWIANHQLWLRGEHPSQSDPNSGAKECKYYAQWEGNPPDVEYYRPDWKDGEATWYQLYETVTEGTPVSPPFATEQELIDYLTAHGEFQDNSPYSREAAERMVRGGWAPSLVAIGEQVYSNAEALLALDAEK